MNRITVPYTASLDEILRAIAIVEHGHVDGLCEDPRELAMRVKECVGVVCTMAESVGLKCQDLHPHATFYSDPERALAAPQTQIRLFTHITGGPPRIMVSHQTARVLYTGRLSMSIDEYRP